MSYDSIINTITILSIIAFIPTISTNQINNIELDLCKNLDKISLGTSCLSDCDGNCNGNIPNDLIFIKELELGSLPIDCPKGKNRLVCTPGSPIIGNYPICELTDTTYCTQGECACWSTCINRLCDSASDKFKNNDKPSQFTHKSDIITNAGCPLPSYRVLCVN